MSTVSSIIASGLTLEGLLSLGASALGGVYALWLLALKITPEQHLKNIVVVLVITIYLVTMAVVFVATESKGPKHHSHAANCTVKE